MCGKINVLGPFPRARGKVPTKGGIGFVWSERNWLWQDSLGLNPKKQAVLRKWYYGEPFQGKFIPKHLLYRFVLFSFLKKILSEGEREKKQGEQQVEGEADFPAE